MGDGEELKEIRKIDKDKLLDDINKVYREGLQEIQDKLDMLWDMEENIRENGGRMIYSEYVVLTDKINYLEKDIKDLRLINNGLENAREIIISTELV